jgi:hypothetical protein
MKIALTFIATFLALSAAPLFAQQEQPPGDNYVSREEYDKLKADHEAMQKELDDLKKMVRQMANGTVPAVPAEGPAPTTSPSDGKQVVSTESSEAAIDDLRTELAKVKEIAQSTVPGTTKFLLTGYAFGGFEKRNGVPSTFNAGVSPILLWKISDKLFFEGELELGLNDSATDLNLEYAHLTYLLNDYITIGIGKFLTPFSQFPARLHPAWVNKLPDFPLAYNEDEGLVPFSQVGVQVNGVIPIGPTKLLYDVYATNGPRLNTSDPGGAGSLQFDNFTDIDNNKAIGGRIAFMPIPELEVGYSIQSERVIAPDTSGDHANVLLQGVDASYNHDFDWLKGGIDLRAEWVWSRVSRLTYDPMGDFGFGPVTFDNRRSGGYAQLAYRPYKLKVPIIEKLEAVGRYDRIDTPWGAPGAFDEERWSIGLNYWLGQSTVIKAAYEFGDRRSLDNGHENVNSILLQAAMGF